MEGDSDAGLRAAEHHENASLAAHRAARMAELNRQGTSECGECGDEIPLRRRQAVPYTRECAPCANLREERDKHRARM